MHPTEEAEHTETREQGAIPGRSRRERLWCIACAVTVLAALALLVWCTRAGMVIGPDSLGYRGMAQGLLSQGNPCTAHWPPGYPVAIALGLSAGLSFQSTVTLINWLCFLGSGALAYCLLRACGLQDGWRTALGLVLFSWSTVIFDLHLRAYSEALFLVVWVAGMCLVLNYVRSGSLASLVGGALVLGLSGWVRHAGLFFTPVPVVAWLVYAKRPWRRRIAGVAALSALALAPVVLMKIVSGLCWGLSAARPLCLHAMGLEKWAELGRTLLTWALPTSLVLRLPQAICAVTGVCALLALAGLVAACLLRCWSAGAVLVSGALLYLLGLVVSVSIADYATPMDSRLLFPVYALAVPFAVALFAKAESWRWRRFPGAVLLAYAIASSGRCLRYGAGHADEPLGYDEAAWSQAEFVPVLKALPAAAVVISNGDYMVSRATGRQVLPIPRHHDPLTRQPVTDSDELRRTLAGQADRPIAILDIASEARPYLEPAQALAASLGLSAVSRGDGWTLYAAAPHGAGRTTGAR